MIDVIKIVVVIPNLRPSSEQISNATLIIACVSYFLHRKTFHYNCHKAKDSNCYKKGKKNRPAISNDVVIDKQKIMCIVVA